MRLTRVETGSEAATLGARLLSVVYDIRVKIKCRSPIKRTNCAVCQRLNLYKRQKLTTTKKKKNSNQKILKINYNFFFSFKKESFLLWKKSPLNAAFQKEFFIPIFYFYIEQKKFNFTESKKKIKGYMQLTKKKSSFR